MNDFNRCKVTGIRWLKKPIEDVQIIVKLKSQDGILSLPKFEDYADESHGSKNIHKLEVKTHEYIFKWQEKVFSSWELQRYDDIHNCLSEAELNYHDMIRNGDYEPCKIFTYIHEDFRLPLPTELKKTISDRPSVANLASCFCFNDLDLNERMSRFLIQIRNVKMVVDTSSTGHLFRSTENIVEDHQWQAMHVVFDNSEYNEDSQLLLKQEAILLSLYYNTTQNYLIISPDVNHLELNPYNVETEASIQLGYQYSIELKFEERTSEELVSVLQKLHKKWERQKKHFINFEMPPLGKKLYFITIELLRTSNFDMDNLYVEFNVKIPEDVQCNSTLHGTTHLAKPVRIEMKDQWHFGHIIELELEATTGADPSPVQVFFEVISADWWGRHRTEGYTYLSLALQPGHYTKQLSCSRPEEFDSVTAESRRFFVGGCHLIKDLEVLVKPQLLDPKIKFVTTGDLHLRWNIILQTALPGSLPRPEVYASTSTSAVLLGAEAVLRQYRKARARLAAATEGLARGEPIENS